MRTARVQGQQVSTKASNAMPTQNCHFAGLPTRKAAKTLCPWAVRGASLGGYPTCCCDGEGGGGGMGGGNELSGNPAWGRGCSP